MKFYVICPCYLILDKIEFRTDLFACISILHMPFIFIANKIKEICLKFNDTLSCYIASNGDDIDTQNVVIQPNKRFFILQSAIAVITTA